MECATACSLIGYQGRLSETGISNTFPSPSHRGSLSLGSTELLREPSLPSENRNLCFGDAWHGKSGVTPAPTALLMASCKRRRPTTPHLELAAGRAFGRCTATEHILQSWQLGGCGGVTDAENCAFQKVHRVTSRGDERALFRGGACWAIADGGYTREGGLEARLGFLPGPTAFRIGRNHQVGDAADAIVQHAAAAARRGGVGHVPAAHPPTASAGAAVHEQDAAYLCSIPLVPLLLAWRYAEAVYRASLNPARWWTSDKRGGLASVACVCEVAHVADTCHTRRAGGCCSSSSSAVPPPRLLVILNKMWVVYLHSTCPRMSTGIFVCDYASGMAGIFS